MKQRGRRGKLGKEGKTPCSALTRSGHFQDIIECLAAPYFPFEVEADCVVEEHRGKNVVLIAGLTDDGALTSVKIALVSLSSATLNARAVGRFCSAALPFPIS